MASDLISDVTEADFQEKVLNSDLPVLVDFWATWCAPCRALAPKVEAVAGEYKDQARVFKLNIDQARKIAMNYNVRSIPTLIAFKNGEAVAQEVGNIDQGKISAMLKDLV